MKNLKKSLRYSLYLLLGCVIIIIIYTTDNKNVIDCNSCNFIQKRKLLFELKINGIYDNLEMFWMP